VADKTADDDLDLKPADAGVGFRVEMFLTNALLGYWKHLVAVVVAGLLGILVWGQYSDWYTGGQRASTAQIAQALARLPADVQQLPLIVAQGEQPIDPNLLVSVADEVVAIANGTKGASRIEGYLTGAELYRLAQKPDKQRAAFESAAKEAPGALKYAAESGLANLDLAEGKGDDAITRLKAMASREKGFLGEQSTIDLGMALEQLGRTDEASKTYDDFITRFPQSTRLDQVKERQARLPGATPAPAPAPAPAEGAPTDGAPAPAPADGAPAPAPADAPAPGGAG
jgi:tetratricopeptide (TPR) repeat protein